MVAIDVVVIVVVNVDTALIVIVVVIAIAIAIGHLFVLLDECGGAAQQCVVFLDQLCVPVPLSLRRGRAAVCVEVIHTQTQQRRRHTQQCVQRSPPIAIAVASVRVCVRRVFLSGVLAIAIVRQRGGVHSGIPDGVTLLRCEGHRHRHE